MPSLFDPIRLGAINAPNRIFMAPLTRARATRQHVPMPIMATYYAQRASAGLIISEATGISREGMGWPYAAGLRSREQVEAWKPVTAAVHGAGGYLLDQFLLDQFLRDSSNLRQDAYGGPVESRIRLLVEVASAVAEEIGAERTAARISPLGMSQGVEGYTDYPEAEPA